MTGLAEEAAAAWPLVVTIACAVAIDRRRERARRASLNRALHELRRPLQALALGRSTPGPSSDLAGPAGGHLDAAIAAVSDLDAVINRRPGGARPPAHRPLRADRLAAEAIDRWAGPTTLLGRSIELRWVAGPVTVSGDRAALGRALDNLLANALEHGGRRISLVGASRGERLRIVVADGGTGDGSRSGELAGPLATGPRPRRDPRRGHGLGIVARIAAGHGGRFASSRGPEGWRAVLELPVIRPRAEAGRSRAPSDAA